MPSSTAADDMDGKSCCAPAANRPASLKDVKPAVTPPDIAKIDIPGGAAILGTDNQAIPLDEEGPARTKKIKPFRIMETAVTNAMFAAFVEDTGFKTEAEEFGWSFVFYHNVSEQVEATLGVQNVEWWRRVEGSYWRLPNGPGAEDDYDTNHPVVHVTWNDARAYAKWAGGRLPNETEWEHAARGGLKDVAFPWGEREPDDEAFQPCNIWQGTFPHHNTAKDGYTATAPAKSFAPNGYGLYNMCGNVWEWTSEPMKIRSVSKVGKAQRARYKGAKLMKGGSFLCHKSYCFRYRIPARTGTTPDTSTSHQGFRLVFDMEGRCGVPRPKA